MNGDWSAVNGSLGNGSTKQSLETHQQVGGIWKSGIGLSAVESISIRGVAKDLKKKKTEHIWRWMERRD
ncbi:unnamed protein product [Caenorhabditis nigoni]